MNPRCRVEHGRTPHTVAVSSNISSNIPGATRRAKHHLTDARPDITAGHGTCAQLPNASSHTSNPKVAGSNPAGGTWCSLVASSSRLAVDRHRARSRTEIGPAREPTSRSCAVASGALAALFRTEAADDGDATEERLGVRGLGGRRGARSPPGLAGRVPHQGRGRGGRAAVLGGARDGERARAAVDVLRAGDRHVDRPARRRGRADGAGAGAHPRAAHGAAGHAEAMGERAAVADHRAHGAPCAASGDAGCAPLGASRRAR